MTLTVIIQIDAIDAVHVFVADILAHSRQDGPSHVMVIEIHNLTICIFVNWISQGAFALQKHREDRFLIDDSHIESLIRFAVGIGLHDFIDQFLQSHIHSHAVRQFTGLDKGAHLIQELFGALGNRCTTMPMSNTPQSSRSKMTLSIWEMTIRRVMRRGLPLVMM